MLGFLLNEDTPSGTATPAGGFAGPRSTHRFCLLPIHTSHPHGESNSEVKLLSVYLSQTGLQFVSFASVKNPLFTFHTAFPLSYQMTSSRE